MSVLWYVLATCAVAALVGLPTLGMVLYDVLVTEPRIRRERRLRGLPVADDDPGWTRLT